MQRHAVGMQVGRAVSVSAAGEEGAAACSRHARGMQVGRAGEGDAGGAHPVRRLRRRCSGMQFINMTTSAHGRNPSWNAVSLMYILEVPAQAGKLERAPPEPQPPKTVGHFAAHRYFLTFSSPTNLCKRERTASGHEQGDTATTVKGMDARQTSRNFITHNATGGGYEKKLERGGGENLNLIAGAGEVHQW